MRVPQIGVAFACMALATGSAIGQQSVQVELLLESFDGCGCLVLNEPACSACEDLDGQGCNVHDGPTNDPHPQCPLAGVPFAHPNYDAYGPESLDDNWWNQGYPADYAGSFQHHNDPGPFPPNFGSQSIVVGNITTGLRNDFFSKIESANIGYISPEDPQDSVGGGFGRILVEQLRQAYALPAPDPSNSEAYLAYDARRVGDGFGGSDPANPGLAMRADLIGVDHQPVPSSLSVVYRPDSERMIPNDGEWATYIIADLNGVPEKLYLGLGVRLDASSQGFPADMTQTVTVWVDNLRLVYWAVAVPEVCDNGIDDDLDGLTDCDDSDCEEMPACTGCQHNPVFDVDDDGDVDHEDFGVLQTCITGTNDPGGVFDTLSEDCKCMDRTGQGGAPDNAVDQQDIAIFEACATGPDIPDPNLAECDDVSP